MWPRKLVLAQVHTPLQRVAALDSLLGCELWVKRDDMTGGPEAGNKIRKLEYLLAAALDAGASTVITCGGVQSNHARATAIVARRLGLEPVLVLRTPDGQPPAAPWQGNLLLDALVGAEIRFITPDQYAQRDAIMQVIAAELGRSGRQAYVIPEGGSNGLGALGYVDAMGEVRAQQDADPSGVPARFDLIVHACGSGGTAAGIGIGARLHGIADDVLAVAVCDDREYFEHKVAAIQHAAFELMGVPTRESAKVRVVDAWKGPAYGVPSAEQVELIETVARRSGLILDPVYSGKAMFALAQLTDKPRRALFVHTGGLPGLLAEAARFTPNG